MRIFVTGIQGFVGRHLARRLAEAGHEIEGMGLDAGPVEGAGAVAVADLRDADAVLRAVKDASPEVVVHLAGQTSVARSIERPAETVEVNVQGAVHVFEACRVTGVGRVLLVSSSEVYGEGDSRDGPVAEDARLAPRSPYAASKVAQEVLAESYGRGFGLDVVRARPFPHTGPGQDARFVFPSVVRRIALAESGRHPPVIEVGDVEVTRDLCDVRDVVAAYEALIERGEPGGVYNVCTGRGTMIREAIAALLEAAEGEVRLEIDPERFRRADVRWIVGDPARIASGVGWVARRRWSETARDLLAWWRERVASEVSTEEVSG